MDNIPPKHPISVDELESWLAAAKNNLSEKLLPTITSYTHLSSEEEHPLADLFWNFVQEFATSAQEFLEKLAKVPPDELQQHQLTLSSNIELITDGKKSPSVSSKRQVTLVVMSVEKDESHIVDSSPPKAGTGKGKVRKRKSKRRKKDTPTS